MSSNPLSPPADASLLNSFAQRFHVATENKSLAALTEIARAFATLPYENLSKVIRYAEAGNSEDARESPSDIIHGHFQWGTGGTCFSLTATLLHLVRSLGFEAEPILADRPYGPNTHCALRVMVEGQPHLLDPGYLIVRPIPIAQSGQTIVDTAFNSVSLAGQLSGQKLELATLESGGWKKRLTFKTDPVDAGEFLKAWDASFDWDMMHYPVLTRVVGNQQIYHRGLFEQTRSGIHVERHEVSADQLVKRIASQFGIAPEVISRAMKLFNR